MLLFWGWPRLEDTCTQIEDCSLILAKATAECNVCWLRTASPTWPSPKVGSHGSPLVSMPAVQLQVFDFGAVNELVATLATDQKWPQSNWGKRSHQCRDECCGDYHFFDNLN